jgi:NAD(P)-dependent dehydrogenase (short-subunit alcohol dehydrogenase family)
MSSSLSTKYAPAYANPQGASDARPTAQQIIEDESLVGRLTGKVFLVTGCSSGIGVETARALASTGATLFLTARNISQTKTELADILEPGRVELVQINLSSLASVRVAAKEISRRTSTLNVLICNAGVMATPYGMTSDGHETQFGTNHLGHFLLFELLKPLLLASVTLEFNSRVVMVSSTGHRGEGIRIGDYDFKKHPEEYTPWNGYSQSKTANIYMANEIERRYGGRGLHATSLTPGAIITPLQKHLDISVREGFMKNEPLLKILLTPEQGAANSVWAAVAKEWEDKGGVFFENL